MVERARPELARESLRSVAEEVTIKFGWRTHGTGWWFAVWGRRDQSVYIPFPTYLDGLSDPLPGH